MGRRVLVTGGAGFLGVHLAGFLRRDGAQVRLFDVAEAPRWAREHSVEYARGDVRDGEAVAAALEGVDTVVHAAFASPRQTPEVIRSVNVDGTRNVCAGALRRGTRHLVLVSSTIVQEARRVHPLFRKSPLTQLDLYRSSRVEAERVAAEYGSRGLRAVMVRPKTFVGPERVGAFAIIFELVRLGRRVPVLGDGRNRYQLLDVRDMAEGIRRLVESDAAGVFFFGAAEFRTVREDLQALVDHASTGARLGFVPRSIARPMLRGMELANFVPLSEWHHMSARGEDSVVDISRAERELGWRPGRSNARALVEAYDWYVARMNAVGSAPSTHPLPLAHRALKKLNGLLLR